MQDDRHVGWRAAMTNALYGEAGFYVAADAPARHFRTAAHTSALWGSVIHRLAGCVDEALGTPTSFTIVDVGAGGGELLAALADLAPPRWSLHGVDVAPRPSGLPDRVGWSQQPPESVTGLLIASELLDVIPLDVAELSPDGLRQVEVSSRGDERLGDLVDGRDAEWLARWWSPAAIGDRAEIGWPRDDMWRSLTSRLERGLVVAIDYAVVPARDVAGTLTGYRDGRQVPPVPDGRADLTAHVHFESLLTDGDSLLSQREVLRSLGLTGDRPGYDGDPTSYLAALSGAGDAAELLDPSGLGGFTWLLHPSGLARSFRLGEPATPGGDAG